MSIFDQYQSKGILPSIGGDDSVYQKLIDASGNITKNLKEDPNKIIAYALVGIDNQIYEEEPILEEIELAIKEEWKMVRSHFIEIPIILYRAIILNSLEALGEEYFPILYWTLIDVYPFVNISKKEKEIIDEFIGITGNATEEKAFNEWSVDKEDVKLSQPRLAINFAENKIVIDVESLEEKLINASGLYARGENQKRPEANPYWTNSQANWSWEFAPRAAKGISEEINKGLNKLNENVNLNSATIETGLKKYFSAINKSLKGAIEESIKSSVAVEQRSQLLWWKETLFSRKLQKSYRQCSEFECAIAMAVDLYEMLPPLFPMSVDYILKETFWKVHNTKTKTTLKSFLEEVDNIENQEFFHQFFEDSEKIDETRMDLSLFITRLVYYKTDLDKDIVLYLGLQPDIELGYDDISLWLLHCLSAKDLAKTQK
jgi:hypothetical protein